MSMIPKDVSDGNFKAPQCKQSMALLAKYGLGKVEEHTAENSIKTLLFTKTSYEEVMTNAELARHVTSLGLDLNDFLDNLKHCEAKDLKNSTTNEEQESDDDSEQEQKRGSNVTSCSSGYDSFHENVTSVRHTDITKNLAPRSKRPVSEETTNSSKKQRQSTQRPVLCNKTNNLPYKLPDNNGLMKVAMQRSNAAKTVIDTSLTIEPERRFCLLFFS